MTNKCSSLFVFCSYLMAISHGNLFLFVTFAYDFLLASSVSYLECVDGI